jgi:hypothetical protein
MKCPQCGNIKLVLRLGRASRAKWYSMYPMYYHCFNCQHSFCKDSLFRAPRVLGYEYHDLNLVTEIMKELIGD